VDFDRSADDYSRRVEGAVSFAGRQHGFFLDAKVALLEKTIERHFGPSHEPSVLDLGCGVGEIGRRLDRSGRRMLGVDVALGPLRRARQVLPARPFVRFDGYRLPFRADGFDLVLAVCVVHHVPPRERPGFFAEMARVVRPGGLAVVFEHNPLNPLTRYAVSRCELDRDAVLLGAREVRKLLAGAGLSIGEQGNLLFFPWAAGPWGWLERKLRAVPLGAQYFVAAEKPDGLPSRRGQTPAGDCPAPRP
jgi:SAM-dependent methyltransferase